MKKYVTLTINFFLFQLKSKMNYRLNFLIESIHAPIYIGVLFLTLLLTYSKTPSLGGLTLPDALLMFLVFNFIYAISFIFFIDSFRDLLWSKIRLGDLDLLMVKPTNLKFLVGFSKPATEGLLYLITILVCSFIYIWYFPISASLGQWLNFVISIGCGIMIQWLILLVYSAAGFYFTKAQQIYEMYHKIADFGQYPLPLFPTSMQFILVTILPMAFLSYFPTALLLGKISPLVLVGSVIFIGILYLLQRIVWYHGLRHYSSASS